MEKKEYIERGAALLAITGQPSELHYPSWYKGVSWKFLPPMWWKWYVVGTANTGHRTELPNTDGACVSNTQADDFCSHGERKEE